TTSLFQANRNFRPFIAVDQEGGSIQRLTKTKGFEGLPGARRVAEMEQAEAYRVYRKSADELARAGINVNLGPVVDLDVDPQSPAIGKLRRSYGSEPQKVIAYARQFIDAFAHGGILTAAKHFPGHGSAKTDPHEVSADITASWQPSEL